jgi:hypothetical protein
MCVCLFLKCSKEAVAVTIKAFTTRVVTTSSNSSSSSTITDVAAVVVAIEAAAEVAVATALEH